MKIKFSNVKIGHNEKIPYKSNFFDLLVSINTIHYSYGNKLNKALFEVSRVLNKDGLAIIETPSNKHDAIKNSIKKSENHWIWKWGGFRQNSIMGFFDNKAKLKRKLKNFFSEVEINERSEIYKNIKLYWFVAICKK
jgi:ubiquinone/menaquinone biosynthesis C-methylase UbiE